MTFIVLALVGLLAAVIAGFVAHRLRRAAARLQERIRQLEPYQVIADVQAYVASQQDIVRQSAQRAAAEADRITKEAERAAAAVLEKANAEVVRQRQVVQQEFAAATADGQRLVTEAHHRANEVAAKSAQDLAGAVAEGQRLISEAQQRANDVSANATHVLLAARAREQEIIQAADQRAKEIAGEALAAVQNQRQAEETVRALKNVIEGYGDAYLVPAHDLLDELGEAYSFEEAGSKLKETRSRIRQMVKDGDAAACDYVEDVRRETAINFVTDAFNGKVATILADVKDDNYGTLAQKIKDAAALVNENGKAFRNARVTHAFLDLRLEELKWAVAANELRERDREEQRLLKERIREEERAQREFEKALKDAEKEEDLLRRAMEKAQAQFDKATEAQKAKYEVQLRELAEKLQAAEEKGKRALSMAQQTKSGHVYVISNVGSFGEDIFKIGLTRRLDPLDRIRELGDASVPFDFDVHALIPSSDAPTLERALHKEFVRRQVNKVNARKEFFRIGIDEIRKAVERAGCQAAWTMKAEARQYRETVALERAMKEGQVREKDWIDQQLEEHDHAMANAENSGAVA